MASRNPGPSTSIPDPDPLKKASSGPVSGDNEPIFIDLMASGPEQTQKYLIRCQTLNMTLPKDFDTSMIDIPKTVSTKIDNYLDERMEKLINPANKTLREIQRQQEILEKKQNIWTSATIAAPVVGTAVILLIAFVGGSSRWLLDASVSIGGISLGVAIVSLLVAVISEIRNMNSSHSSRIDNLGDQYVSLGGSLNNLGINLSGQVSNLSSQINEFQNKNIILPK